MLATLDPPNREPQCQVAPSVPRVLEAHGLAVEVAGNRLLGDVSFKLGRGQKVAIVGPNGAGKTTLLRTLAGDLAPAEGRVVRPKMIGWMVQNSRASDQTQLALDRIMSARPAYSLGLDLEVARARLAEVGDDPVALEKAISVFSKLEHRFADEGGYRLEAEAEIVASGLGVDAGLLLSELGELSGGQLRRVELSRVLFGGSDLLLLDEPTNHLDFNTRDWVLDFLKKTEATVLVVSHDIELLDDSIDRVLHVSHGRVELYSGNYSKFQQVAAAVESDREKRLRLFNERVGKLKATANRFRGGNEDVARKAKVIDSRVKRMQQEAEASGLMRAGSIQRQKKVRLPEPERSGDLVIQAKDLTFAYDGPPVLDSVELVVRRKERVVVVGLNGAGKTTLLKCLSGVLEPQAGSVRLGVNVTLGYFDQEQDDLPGDSSPLSILREVAPPELKDPDIRALLGQFGVVGDTSLQPSKTLSGGERVKTSLARLVLTRSNLLVLDEPSNNLDPASRDAVAEAFSGFQGTIILVSHDTDFVAALDPQWALILPQGLIVPFDDTILELVAMA